MLTAKQLRFIDEYSLSHSASDAARKAGYSIKTAGSIGHENLKKPEILAAIQVRQQIVAKGIEVTKQNILAALLEAIQTAREQRNPAVMVASAREIGKLCGFYSADVQQVDGSFKGGGMAAKFATMSDQELETLIEGRCPA